MEKWKMSMTTTMKTTTIEETRRKIGAFLKEKRKEAGIGTQKLSAITGVSKMNIIGLEAGRGSNLDTVIKVMKALGVDSLPVT